MPFAQSALPGQAAPINSLSPPYDLHVSFFDINFVLIPILLFEFEEEIIIKRKGQKRPNFDLSLVPS